jgi:hypothetical protein
MAVFQCTHAMGDPTAHTPSPLSMEPYFPWQNAGELTVRETRCKQPECPSKGRNRAHLTPFVAIRMDDVA